MEGSELVAARERWPGGDSRAGGIDFAVAIGRVRVRTTEAVSLLDLTARVEGFLRSAGLEAGWVNVHTCHATTGLCVSESEPVLLTDLLFRASETLNVAAGRLRLGRHRRVLLLDLDGPREREVSLFALGEKGR